MLTKEQLKARDGKLTASRVGVLVNGSEEDVLFLWKEMLGLEKSPDLSRFWPVRLGETTEQLNLDWYEYKIGHDVTRRGEVASGEPDWMACTLDGWDVQRNCPIEAKCVGGRESIDVIIARYQPQLQWQMLVTGAKQVALSIISGGAEPIVEMVPYDEEYAIELFKRAEAFMRCVQTLTPPVALPEVKPPVVPAKEYDFNGNPGWHLLAGRWLQVVGAAQQAKECEKAIKDLVPEDAKKAFGAGITVTRNRAGSLALREAK